MMKIRKKLIEVALPLEKINAASAREKSIRHGHPSTLHLWWSRKPTATARAVIFAQLVDDPAACPEDFPTEAAQDKKREQLFRLIEQLVLWENTTNETVLGAAREEIWASWRRTCADNADHPRAAELFDPAKLPAFHDPFAGGGALPLEAQRLGLESYASDLNPVAVLINKAMIEIPPTFANQPPVNPEARAGRMNMAQQWRGAAGLAEDVRYYGKWMRDEAEKRIGHLYPKVEITAEMAAERPDLKPYVGRKLTVIAWLWARTVKSPNPAFAHVDVPLASTFMLSTKAGKEVYVDPILTGNEYRFDVKIGKPRDSDKAKNGTKISRGSFRCLFSDTPIPYEYIDDEANSGRISARIMALVVEGDRERVYLSAPRGLEQTFLEILPDWKPETPSRGTWASNAQGRRYGFYTFGDYFTNRQLVMLTTFVDLIKEACLRARNDALDANMFPDTEGLDTGGKGAMAYSEAISVYISFALSKVVNINSSIASWMNDRGAFRETFARQAIPMTWEFAEANPLTDVGGSFQTAISKGVMALQTMPSTPQSFAAQRDASTQDISADKVVSTDPPYYDNVGYADLSDFFYVWLRRSMRRIFPQLFATLAVPKDEEIIATVYRHGSKAEAETFFLQGMTGAIKQIKRLAHQAFPVSIYYAFKQSEVDDNDGIASTGWETFLDAIIQAGFSTSGTWPIRTEGSGRMTAQGTNALASSIVLVCRRRPDDAPAVTRRDFVAALKRELPAALAHLQRGNIAPVDLAQAAIGPGMAVFTRYGKVLDAAGAPISVREALTLINQLLDEVLTEQEGDFDGDTRWALAWFDQHGFGEAAYGDAETLSKAKNTSVSGMVEAGLVASKAGKVRLLRPEELAADWDPAADERLTVWEMVHHLVRALAGGEEAAAALAARIGGRVDVARELAYRLYTVCERKKRAAEALAYNGLVQSWPELMRLASAPAGGGASQSSLFGED